MDLLAQQTGEEGKYIVYVGSARPCRCTTSGPMRRSPTRRRSTRTLETAATAWRRRKPGRQLQDRARPAPRPSQTSPASSPSSARRGPDRRLQERSGRSRQGRQDRGAGRRLLPRPGREIRQGRHHPWRLHLEPDDRRRDLRPGRDAARRRQAAHRQHGADRGRAGAHQPGEAPDPGAEAGGARQGEHRPAGGPGLGRAV